MKKVFFNYLMVGMLLYGSKHHRYHSIRKTFIVSTQREDEVASLMNVDALLDLLI